MAGARNDDWARSYSFDPVSRVYRAREPRPEFGYSEGDEVEDRLARIVAGATDLSVGSQELASHIRDWPSRYHLSPQRANLVRPLEALLTRRVLEVGAGCGAVTRHLGEIGAHVVALEGSPRRAKVAASRCRDLENVSVCCDSFELFPTGARFDVVTLIGVLEYAGRHGHGPDPVQAMLERCRELLSEDGCLVLAIENQLGLKYFAGFLEDHTDQPMFGIEDLYHTESVATFGRLALTRRLSEAGFRSVDVYVPLPDYKFAQTVVTPAGLADGGWLDTLTSLVMWTPAADPQPVPLPLFSLEQAWRAVVRNGLLADLASSFLFVAAPARRSAQLGGQALAFHYSAARRPEFMKGTAIRRIDAVLQAESRQLSKPRPGDPGVPLRQRVSDEPFREGRLWSEDLSAVVNRPGWSVGDVVAWAHPWLEALIREIEAEKTVASTPVPGHLADAAPFNLIVSPGGASHFIDLEWETAAPIELGFVLFRGLFHTLARYRNVAPPENAVPLRYSDLIREVSVGLGIPLSLEDLARYVRQEWEFQAWAAGAHSDATLEQLSSRELYARPRLDLLARSARQIARRSEEQLRDARDRELSLERRLANETRRASERAAESHARSARLVTHRLEAGRLALEQQFHDLWAAAVHRVTRMLMAPFDILRLLRRQRRLGARELARVLRLPAEASAVRKSGLFDPMYYLAGRAPGPLCVSPLVHYLVSGHAEASDPHPLFDSRYYEERNPDVAASGMNPLVHFVRRGAQEGRDPSPWFDSPFYRESRPPLAADVAALTHYLARGAREGRKPNPWFDTAYYARSNPDVQKSGVNPLIHFVTRGIWEGRDPSPWFDTVFYRMQAPDVDESGLSPFVHFLTRGVFRGLDPAPLFDTTHYLERHPEAGLNGANPYLHFLRFGLAERRNPSPWFDADHYLQSNPDLAAAGLPPLVHYLESGAREGRDPNLWFDTSFYLEQNPDVAAAGVNPLVHFIRWGMWEGRNPCPWFDTRHYLRNNPDAASSSLSPLAHFLAHGAAAGFDPSPWFDCSYYLEKNHDVAQAHVNPCLHFFSAGFREGRNPTPWFDMSYYLAGNSDVARAGVNPLIHYLEQGASERRSPNPFFDVSFYLEHNGDVARAAIDPLLHYIQFGGREGRDPSPRFDSSFYLETNPDVADSGMNPLVHYIVWGAAEGRRPRPDPGPPSG